MKLRKLMQYLSSSDRDKIIDIISDRATWFYSQCYSDKNIEKRVDQATAVLNQSTYDIEHVRTDRYDYLVGRTYGGDEETEDGPIVTAFENFSPAPDLEPTVVIHTANPEESLRSMTDEEMDMYIERVKAGEKITAQINGHLETIGSPMMDALGYTALAVKSESIIIDGRHFKSRNMNKDVN